MKQQARNELFIGLSITIATLIVVVGILFLQQSPLFVQGLQLRMEVPNAQGIGKGSEVHFRGVKAGTVTDVEVQPEKVTVSMRINNITDIPRDSEFSIASTGLLGGKAVQINPGNSEKSLENGTLVQGTTGGGISAMAEEITSQLGGVEEELTLLLDNLNALFNRETRQEVRALLRESRAASEKIQVAVDENSDNLEETLASLRSLSEESRKPLNNSLQQIEAGTKNLDSAMARLHSVGARLDTLLQELEQGQGTAGSLMKDEELYRRLNSSLTDLEALLKDIKENPDKYMTIKIF